MLYGEGEWRKSVYFQIDIKVIEVITQFCDWKLFLIDFLTFPHIYIYIQIEFHHWLFRGKTPRNCSGRKISAKCGLLSKPNKKREGGRDGCKSCDTPARLLIQKEEEEAGAADKRRLPRSEPLWPGYKRENPGPVCLEAGRPARGNRSSAARSPESFLLSVVSPVRKRKRSPREEMEHGVQRRRSVSPSCVANARSCLFIGFTRRYGTAKKNISTTAGRPL